MVKSGPIYWCTFCEKMIGYDEECQMCFKDGDKLGWMVTND